MAILVTEAFALKEMYHIIQDKSPFQLVFFQYMFLPINHVAYWKFYVSEIKRK